MSRPLLLLIPLEDLVVCGSLHGSRPQGIHWIYIVGFVEIEYPAARSNGERYHKNQGDKSAPRSG